MKRMTGIDKIRFARILEFSFQFASRTLEPQIPKGVFVPSHGFDSLIRTQTWNMTRVGAFPKNGADDGNRTRVKSLEGSGSTIELHPHCKDRMDHPMCE